MGRARQHHAELRRDDMRDALLGIAEIEDADAVAGGCPRAWRAGRRRRPDWSSSVRPGLVATVWSCIEKVRSGRAHRALLLLELLEGVRRVQLMQHMAVDIDEIAAVDALRDEMGVPDLVEQGAGHEVILRGPTLWAKRC